MYDNTSPYGYWGFVTMGVYDIDEFFTEFDVSSTGLASAAYFNFDMLNRANFGLPDASQSFKVAAYIGNGSVDFSGFGSGSFFV